MTYINPQSERGVNRDQKEYTCIFGDLIYWGTETKLKRASKVNQEVGKEKRT